MAKFDARGLTGLPRPKKVTGIKGFKGFLESIMPWTEAGKARTKRLEDRDMMNRRADQMDDLNEALSGEEWAQIGRGNVARHKRKERELLSLGADRIPDDDLYARGEVLTPEYQDPGEVNPEGRANEAEWKKKHAAQDSRLAREKAELDSYTKDSIADIKAGRVEREQQAEDYAEGRAGVRTEMSQHNTWEWKQQQQRDRAEKFAKLKLQGLKSGMSYYSAPGNSSSGKTQLERFSEARDSGRLASKGASSQMEKFERDREIKSGPTSGSQNVKGAGLNV